MQTMTAVEQGNCQQGDEIQQCSAGSTTGKRKHSARWSLLGKSEWVTTAQVNIIPNLPQLNSVVSCTLSGILQEQLHFGKSYLKEARRKHEAYLYYF